MSVGLEKANNTGFTLFYFIFNFINRALDILEEINRSLSRKNKFSEAAYNKLLNNNLSLKYSQTGYLSSSNIISDGFYDYGRVSGNIYLCFTMISPLITHDAITLLFYKHQTYSIFFADRNVKVSTLA